MLEARSLTKYYNHTAAVRGVSFAVQPGEILGYLGPNGAGKSTTVKMLTGLIEPSEGRIFYQGRSVYDDFPAFQRRIGYVPEEAHLYPHLSGSEYLQLVGRLRGMPRRVLEPKMDEFLRLFSLWDDRHAPLSEYSKGMRQKILLSSALLHNPDILILDEPFSGLDVTSALALRSLLRALAAQGKTIFYSSHVLEVVEKICSKVVILRKGEVAAYDSIERLRDLMSQPSLEGVFAQLTEVEDGDALAGRIVEVMRSGDASAPKPVAIALRISRTLAGALPQEFGNVYGAEMLQDTEDAVEPIWRRHGLLGLSRLLADAAVRVPIEYLAEFRKDARQGLRMLARSPGFTAVALISLSLGASIATCALSEMNSVVLRNVPGIARPGELAALQMPVSYPDYRRFREIPAVFSSTTAWLAPVPFDVNRERIWGHVVTPSYFSTLGVSPALGRFFDLSPQGAEPAVPVVTSYRFWQEHLGSDPSAIGKTLRVSGQTATIIGVGPPGFLGASPMLYAADLWLPISAGAGVAPELAGNTLERHDRAILHFTARLRQGITMKAAAAALDTVARKIERDYGDPDRDRPGRRAVLLDGGKLFQFREQDKPFFTSFFLLIAGLMMLIPCTNVANMMLARAAGRRREIAVRLALGASRARLIRQLLTESLIVAAAASTLGFLASMWLMRLLSRVKMPWPVPVGYDMRPDGHVLLFALGLMVVTNLLFGLAPALQATRTDIATALKEGGTVLVRRNRRLSLRNLLVVCQIAGTLTLLTVLGLQSFGIQTTLGVQQGFDLKNLYLVSVDPVRDGYSGEQSAAFLGKLLERVKALPSVTAATLTLSVPVSMPGSPVRILRPAGGNSGALLSAFKHVVGRDYFDTTGIPILRGRGFRREDEGSASAAIVVSEALAREYWKSEDPVGRQLEIESGASSPGNLAFLPWLVNDRPGALANGSRVFDVVGVARDVAEGMVVQKPRPTVYFPMSLTDYRQPPPTGVTLILRAPPGANALTAVSSEIAGMDPRIVPFNARSMDQQVDRFVSILRTASWTYGFLWVFGLVLAVVGIAGATAWAVTRRTREIGIRMALGARSNDVLRLVMKDGALLVAVGMAAGSAGAWGASGLLASMNSSVGQVTSTSASNPAVVFGAPLMLACLALLACYLPARRSLRIDPAMTLRQE
ncbi:MAG: ADOP family duplicated permease [Bryobacteraceae bacterium]